MTQTILSITIILLHLVALWANIMDLILYYRKKRNINKDVDKHIKYAVISVVLIAISMIPIFVEMALEIMLFELEIFTIIRAIIAFACLVIRVITLKVVTTIKILQEARE